MYNSFNSWGWLDHTDTAIKNTLDVFAGDIRDPHGVHVAAQGCDAVLHLAALIGIPYSYHSPTPISTPNVKGTLNVVQAARELRIKRVIHTSTSEVYGNPQVHPQPESYWGNCDPIGPRSVYDEAKRFAEALTMAYHRFHGVDTHIVRIFNTYGPRMRLDDGRAVPNFIQQALRHEPLTIYGDGSQTRSFVLFLTDRWDLQILLSDEHDPVNIGNPSEITIRDFALAINRITDNPAGILHKDELRLGDDPQRRQPDITRAKTILGWTPHYSLDEGIALTIPYFKQKLSLS